MAKIKYDVRGVESGGTFDQPKPGLYACRLKEVRHDPTKSGDPMDTYVSEVLRGDYKGAWLWDRVSNPGAENMRWKMRQLLEAFGVIKGKKGEKGTYDPDDHVGEKVMIRVKGSTYQNEYSAEVGAVLPMPDAEDEDEPEDEDVEPEDSEDEDDEGTTEDLTYEDLEEMDLDDLKDIIEEEELEIRVTKRSKLETILEKVAEALELEPEEDEDEDPEDEEEELEDYEEWSPADLKAEAKERGLKSTGSKKLLVKRLEEDDEEEEDDEPF